MAKDTNNLKSSDFLNLKTDQFKKELLENKELLNEFNLFKDDFFKIIDDDLYNIVQSSGEKFFSNIENVESLVEEASNKEVPDMTIISDSTLPNVSEIESTEDILRAASSFEKASKIIKTSRN